MRALQAASMGRDPRNLDQIVEVLKGKPGCIRSTSAWHAACVQMLSRHRRIQHAHHHACV